MLNSTTHEVGGVLVITLEDVGEVADRQPTHREVLYKQIQARDDPRFVVDLGRLDYMSSADLGFLISLRRRVDARKGQLALFNVDPFVSHTLGTMKLLSLFPMAGTLEEALALLPPAIP